MVNYRVLLLILLLLPIVVHEVHHLIFLQLNSFILALHPLFQAIIIPDLVLHDLLHDDPLQHSHLIINNLNCSYFLVILLLLLLQDRFIQLHFCIS